MTVRVEPSALLRYAVQALRRGPGRGVAASRHVNCMLAILLAVTAMGLSAQDIKTPEQMPPALPAGAVTGVKIEPDHVTLAPGESKQFVGTVEGTGTYSATLKWSVNDVDGGKVSLGTHQQQWVVSSRPIQRR